MSPFAGFPAGKTSFTPVPDLFYTDLLPAIDDLAELKLTLYMFWALNRQRGYPRYLTSPELEAESLLLTTMSRVRDGDPLATLRAAVKAAVARGTLLQISIRGKDGSIDHFFMNTPQGRKAIQQIKDGELVLEVRGAVYEPHIERERPRVYELYEQNIGLLQPLLVEELQQAERDFPPEWIEDAFRIAVERNARNWRYIRAILDRWAREGRDDAPSRGSSKGERAGSGAWDRR